MRNFCTAGVCDPKKNYVVDVSGKAREIIELIDRGEYFCMNRARQYGKSSMLERLEEMLSPNYYVILVSFEEMGDEVFKNGNTFVPAFLNLTTKYMKQNGFPRKMISVWNGRIVSILRSLHSIGERLTNWISDSPFSILKERIVRLCGTADKPVVLLIDEVDQASNNKVFLDFLGMLRANYLRSKKEASFQSVILAGVTDITNLRAKVRPEEEHRVNSPWNIAEEFNVDMSFSTTEIAGMLREYEKDHSTGMDIQTVSRELRYLTSGYPYIVSWLCNWLDTKGGRNWTAGGVQTAGRAFIKSNSPLLDDLRKNMVNHPELEEILINILYYGSSYTLQPLRTPVQLGIMYGYLKDDGANCAKVTNLLFEKYLYEYSVAVMRDSMMKKREEDKSQFVQGAHLNVMQILNRFQALLNSEYRSEDGRFIEQHGRLLFLCFIKPIINGTGHYYVEPQTRSNDRMDVVISYGTEEHIVELKIWYGPKYRREGIRQLEKYMDSREAHSGYLLSFNFQKTDRTRSGWLSPEETDKQIYEVIIQCSG